MTEIFLLACVFVSAADGDTMTARDGDTTTPLGLAEIDAPERAQPYSQVSRRNLDESCRMARAVEITPVGAEPGPVADWASARLAAQQPSPGVSALTCTASSEGQGNLTSLVDRLRRYTE